MSVQVLMPALSPTMTEGKLAKWLKQEGDAVNSGDVLAEIETDKATMEVEAVGEGVLGKILVPEGTEGVAVNSPIALLLEEGEDASTLKTAPAAEKPATPAATTPAASTAAATTKAPPPASSSAKVVTPAPEAGPPAADRKPTNRLFASPLARRMAAQAHLDLSRISGSGPHGRIVKADVEHAIAEGAAARAPAPELPKVATAAEPPSAAKTPTPPPEIGPAYIEAPNSTTRKVIAKRLAASKREIPHYYLTIDCHLDALLNLREQLNSRAPKEGPGAYKLSVNDFVIRAVALALRAYPSANSSWTDEAIRLYQTIDVCVAVAASNGLITPVVRNADHKGLAAISNEVRELAKRARDGKLKPEEYQGGGFTVSNLGMYGIRGFAAIINPPQSCLLAVGAAEKRPVVKDEALAVATMMTCTLSADHRSVDGAKGAEFLDVFKSLIEEPLTMLL